MGFSTTGSLVGCKGRRGLSGAGQEEEDGCGGTCRADERQVAEEGISIVTRGLWLRMDGGMIQRILVGVLLAATLLPTDEAGSFGGGDVLQGTDCCTSIVRGGIRGAVAFALPLAVGKGWGGAGRRKCRATQIPSPACGSFALAGGSEARPLLLRRLDSAAARAELSPATSVRASSGERGAGGGYSERANRGKESKRMV